MRDLYVVDLPENNSRGTTFLGKKRWSDGAGTATPEFRRSRDFSSGTQGNHGRIGVPGLLQRRLYVHPRAPRRQDPFAKALNPKA